MERRDFLKQAGAATALAALTAGTGYFFHNRERSRAIPVVTAKKDFAVQGDPSLPRVAFASDVDPLSALNRSLDAVGGIQRFVKPGESVTIKPNVGWDRTPEQAANTNPQLVAEMVRLCLQAGAAQVVVTDVTCNEARRCFLRSGIREEAERAGARVVLPVDEDFVRVNLQGEILTVWPVLRYFVETDRLINMPIVKQHSLCRCTIGMKNFYGILGGRRNQLHQEIDRSIVDLARYCQPTLTVVDATRVLMRGGPQGGSLDDVTVANSVICATDQVAADARAVEFLNLRPEQVGHIVLADRVGLGSMDYRSAGYQEVA